MKEEEGKERVIEEKWEGRRREGGETGRGKERGWREGGRKDTTTSSNHC